MKLSSSLSLISSCSFLLSLSPSAFAGLFLFLFFVFFLFFFFFLFWVLSSLIYLTKSSRSFGIISFFSSFLFLFSSLFLFFKEFVSIFLWNRFLLNLLFEFESLSDFSDFCEDLLFKLLIWLWAETLTVFPGKEKFFSRFKLSLFILFIFKLFSLVISFSVSLANNALFISKLAP